ncbi:MAG: hypothetical protein IPO93_13840 [Actinobacteria bacterium]|nr:hypothetical protein [Actinomycetota bacterium]
MAPLRRLDLLWLLMSLTLQRWAFIRCGDAAVVTGACAWAIAALTVE